MTDDLADVVWDVCIIGAGPAGLAVAAELAGSSHKICVVDTGDGVGPSRSFPPVTLTGEDPYPAGQVDDTHAAGIGGTATMWSFQLVAAGESIVEPEVGCRYAPMQPLDLEARPEVGTPGWPIERAELDRWSARAQSFCGLGPYRYDVAAWEDEANRPLTLPGGSVVTSMFQFGPASAFVVDARADLASRGVAFLTGTTALWLEPEPHARRVAGVSVDTPGGVRTLRARSVVLAAGGIETVRLLLDTGRHRGQAPGDHAGLVGRFFMEHPLVRGGLLVTDPGRHWLGRLGLYGTRRVDGTCVSAKFTLTDELVRAEGLLACSALLVPRDGAYGTRGSEALARLRSPSGQREPIRRQAANALRVLTGAPGVARAVLAGRRGQPTIDRADWTGMRADPRFSVFEILHQTEQSPDPANRLTLGETVDELGRSEVRLDWRWSSADQRRIGRSRDLFARAFADAGLGRTINTDWDDGRPRMLGGTHHHIGTTRMSADPSLGVVDPDCRVHHWPNLYVASSAVFPSAGFVNPTLTIVALGLRLGAHLRSALGAGTARLEGRA